MARESARSTPAISPIRRRRVPWIAGALVLACTRTSTPTEAPTQSSPDGSASELVPKNPSNRSVGERLELAIPRFDGGTMPLASLRGRAVLLEISASWEAGWTEMHRRYPALVDTLGATRVAVVLISLDGDTASLERDASPATPATPAIIRAWDPMGALAARLGVATFPTYFVLDPQGRIVAVLNRYDDATFERVEGELRRALDSDDQ